MYGRAHTVTARANALFGSEHRSVKPPYDRALRFVAVTDARYVSALLALLTVWWIALAIAPLDRQDWLLETALVVVAVAVLAVTASQERGAAPRGSRETRETQEIALQPRSAWPTPAGCRSGTTPIFAAGQSSLLFFSPAVLQRLRYLRSLPRSRKGAPIHALRGPARPFVYRAACDPLTAPLRSGSLRTRGPSG
jgi:hypothetical protein